MNDAAQEISRNKAAALLKKSPRTISRWEAQGRLTKLSSGNFSLEEVENLAAELDGQADGASELREGFEQATDHAERLLKLIEEPLKVLVKGYTEREQRDAKRIADLEREQQESWKLVREVMLAKHEEARIEADAAAKREVTSKGMALLEKHVPVLIEQIGGEKMAMKFLASLTPDQLGAVEMLETALTPTQREVFAKMINAAFPDRSSASESPKAAEAAS